MTSLLRIERRDDIAVVHLDNPPVNALSAALRASLHDTLAALQADASVRGVVIAGSGRAFSAGADVAEFQAAPGAFAQLRDPADITALLDDFSKPVVAALHGFALGGGLELAMGCHWRIAAAQTRLGLPEIALGILPGAGGTQRLPRLVGQQTALAMMLSGQPLDARQALQAGLIDGIAETTVVEDAVAFLWQQIWVRQAPRKTRSMPVPADPAQGALPIAVPSVGSLPAARRGAAAKIIACVQAASERPFDHGMGIERRAFVECLHTPEAAALQHAFFAERLAGRLDGSPEGQPVRRVGVVGGGTMGRGIAMAAANVGLPVVLVETDLDRARGAASAIAQEYRQLAARGRLTAQDAEDRAALVTPVGALDALAACDLVIEAVFEDMAVKIAMAEQLGRVCKPGAVIASNTSTLDIDRLAQASGRPEHFLGLHFFSPAHVMRLVEVIRGAQTSARTMATAVALARTLRKVPVVCGVCWGFIGNRMLEPYLRETEALLLEGATPSQIDRVLESFGMAMGPCRMMDLAGVDVVAKVVQARALDGTLPPDPLYRIVARHMSELGRQGQKSSEGFYRYEGRRPLDDHDAVSLIASLARRHGVVQRTGIDDQEILDRCLLPLINEGFRILEEGIAERASDIDVVWLSGYGFPQATGGPLFHAARLGHAAVVRRLVALGARLGNAWNQWTPAATLQASLDNTTQESLA